MIQVTVLYGQPQDSAAFDHYYSAKIFQGHTIPDAAIPVLRRQHSFNLPFLFLMREGTSGIKFCLTGPRRLLW